MIKPNLLVKTRKDHVKVDKVDDYMESSTLFIKKFLKFIFKSFEWTSFHVYFVFMVATFYKTRVYMYVWAI